MARSTSGKAKSRRQRTLYVIGGAEDKVGSSVVLKRFLSLAGGRKARVVVVPTASSFVDEVVETYTRVFTRLHASVEVSVVHVESRQEAADPELVERMASATGIFFSGGSQLKLSQYYPGTPVGDAVHAAYQRGVVVGGTSAGASIMSRFMISMGDEGITPRQRMSQLTAGLGLLDDVVLDQHFDQRGRYGRLLSIVANSPQLLGVGIDENTAAEIRDEEELRVHGAGGVFVVDARQAVTDAPDARRRAPLLVSGAVVHSLPAGATFDLREARLTDFVERHPDVDVRGASARERQPAPSEPAPTGTE